MNTTDADTLAAALTAVTDQHGRTLADLSAERPVLVLCVRHTGCTFCREALADLSAARNALAEDGIGIAIVHMSPEAVAATLCNKYGLGDVSRFADPERRVYAALALPKGGPRELLSPRVWMRGYSAAIAAGHGFGTIIGSVRQLAGAAVIFRGAVVAVQRTAMACDRLDLRQLANSAGERCGREVPERADV